MYNNNTFYKTFTGIDTLAFALFPNCKPILLGSLTTFSYSIYREKKPVPLLGKINVGGYTRGMRSIAGTMIFTLMNQHFVRDLVKQIPYLAEHGKIKGDELPFFDMMIIGGNEYGSTAKMMIYGIDLFEDGQIVSIQDMYIENSISFVARDIDEFDSSNPVIRSRSGRNVSVNSISSFLLNDNNYIDDSINRLSDDLVKVQSKLSNGKYMSGVYDNRTFMDVMKFQKSVGLRETGYLDSITYDVLLNDKKALKITSKNNNFVYNETFDRIIGIANYMDNYIYHEEGEGFYIDFYGHKGYVNKENVTLLDKGHCTDGISLVKHILDRVNKNTTKVYLDEGHYNMSVYSIYGIDKMEVSQVEVDCSEFSIYENLPHRFVYDMDYGYPTSVEVVVFKENKILSKYIFDLRGVIWEDN